MKKRALSAILAIVCIFSLMTVAFADDSVTASDRVIYNGVDITVDIDEEISRALNGITDVEAQATCSLSDDSSDNSTYTTTRRIGSVDGTDSCVYATTSVKRCATNSSAKGYVTAFGTIYWVDNFGTANNLVSISGGWKFDEKPNGTYARLTGKHIFVKGTSDARHQRTHTFDYRDEYIPDNYTYSVDEMPEIKALNDFTTYCYTATAFVDGQELELYVATSIVDKAV